MNTVFSVFGQEKSSNLMFSPKGTLVFLWFNVDFLVFGESEMDTVQQQ